MQDKEINKENEEKSTEKLMPNTKQSDKSLCYELNNGFTWDCPSTV